MTKNELAVLSFVWLIISPNNDDVTDRADIRSHVPGWDVWQCPHRQIVNYSSVWEDNDILVCHHYPDILLLVISHDPLITQCDGNMQSLMPLKPNSHLCQDYVGWWWLEISWGITRTKEFSPKIYLTWTLKDVESIHFYSSIWLKLDLCLMKSTWSGQMCLWLGIIIMMTMVQVKLRWNVIKLQLTSPVSCVLVLEHLYLITLLIVVIYLACQHLFGNINFSSKHPETIRATSAP